MNFVQIRSFDNYVSANILLSLLQDEGINCYLKDEYTVTIDPFLNNAIGGIKLMVYEMQAERAEAVLENADKNFLQTVPCPDCGHCALEKKVQIKKPRNFLEKIYFLLLNGTEQQRKIFYACSYCHSVFNEIPLKE
ncbi:MAG: DUF2007 domain-containing protein [Bacteroidota bacterium]